LIYSVLVVDDHELWRCHVRGEVRKHSRWRVIGEASDGVEAVRKAEALNPDLILLDVGLPTLNGLEVARRILARDQHSRILFLSEQRSADIIEAALHTGARGYMCKADAEGDKLLLAMEATVNNGRFLSVDIPAHVVQAGHAPIAEATCRHEAGFHSDERSVVDAYARVAEAALAAGSTFVLVAAPSRRNTLRQQLHARGVLVDDAIREGRYVPLDADSVLSTFMIDGWPDEARFRTAAADLISAAAKAAKGHHPRVALCGDGAPGLWTKGHAEAVLRLERLWNELPRTCHLDIFCGYPLNASRLKRDGYDFFRRMCTEHSGVHVR
jgi:DNA-binding NarL/FixJ family response regulator